MEDDLAIGMGGQAVLELALPELDRGLHARLPEAQGVVVLAAKRDAHGGFVARRGAAVEAPARMLCTRPCPSRERLSRQIL